VTPAPRCHGETAVVLVDASNEPDLYAAYLLAGVLSTNCIVDAGDRHDEKLPAATLALMDTATLTEGYAIGGTAAVPSGKLTVRLVWRRAGGEDRWATLRIVGDAASNPAKLPRVDPKLLPETQSPSQSGDSAADTFTDVSAGGWHSCGLRVDGTIECWGYEVPRRTAPPSGTFSAVSAGSLHSCGLRVEGTIDCWGINHQGQATPPDGTFTAVSAGGGHSCGLRTTGVTTCWGSDDDGEATAPDGTFIEVSAGGFHSCGLRTDGTLECWGADDQLARTSTDEIVRVRDGRSSPPDGEFVAISAGGEHSCGLRRDGTVACWGNNGSGQATPPGGTFTSADIGGKYSCGVLPSGRIAC